MESIGLKIRKLRELKGYSRVYLAEMLEISERSYGKIENAECSITIERLEQIANKLEIDVINLIQFDETLIFNKSDTKTKQVKSYTFNGLMEAIRAKDELILFLKNQLNK